ncbi:MAG: succinate dehydrogenase, hydrophobic membrane anchor protein [Acidiferrobacterales bacterium]
MIHIRPAGSAHRGLGEWTLQRLTAIYMAGYAIVLPLRWLAMPGLSYEAWRHWAGAVSVRVSATLFFVSAIIHAWIGLRSVYMDYLQILWLRLAVVILTAAMLAAVLVWAVGVLWGGAG